jgi:hypothetical protein
MPALLQLPGRERVSEVPADTPLSATRLQPGRAMPDDGLAMTKLRTTTHRVPLPALRAAVFAVVGTVLGVSAHHLIAEGPVPWRQSAVAAAVLFGVGLAGARRPRSLTGVVAASAAGQIGLHLWLTATHAHRSTARVMPSHTDEGMDAHVSWHERLHDSMAMTAVHALAAVLVAVLLHRADAVCWSLARGLTSVVAAVDVRIATAWAVMHERPASMGPGPLTIVLAWLEGPPPKVAVLADVVVRRGPPQAGLALVL